MKSAKRAVIIVFLVLFAALWSAAAQADLYWENETVTAGVPHQTDGTRLQKNYFIPTASRIETGDGNVIIFDYDTMTMYTLDPRAKSYSRLNLNELGMPPEMGKMMAEMMKFQVTPTEETKVIEGYKCRKYNADLGMIKGVYWVSKDVKGYQELRDIGQKLGSVVEKNPMIRQMNVAGMIEKLDGFPVMTVNNIMGGTVTTTLKKVEQKKLDPGLFKVPGDYVQKGR